MNANVDGDTTALYYLEFLHHMYHRLIGLIPLVENWHLDGGTAEPLADRRFCRLRHG